MHWLKDGLAALSGGLLVLTYAPLDAWYLTLPLLAILLWTWHQASYWRAAWRGFLFGLTLYGFGVSWVYISLHHYGNAPILFAGLANVILILYLALYPALTGYLLNRFWSAAPVYLRFCLVVPALWTLLDWLRSWILLGGFPWLALGYSQTDSPLASLAPIAGVYGIGLILLLGAGLGIIVLIQRNLWPLLGLVLIGVLIWVADQLRWTEPVGEPVRISMIQGNIEQKQKWQPEILEQTLQRYVELSAEVAADSDLIIWPETAIPLFYEDLDPVYRAQLQRLAEQTQTDLLIGAPSGSWEERIFYNGILAINANPDQQGGEFYRKRRLLPFGEYLPLRFLFDLFHRFVEIPMADFTPGAAKQALPRAAGYPVGVSICFEAAFGSEIRRALPEAALLVNVSNDGWFGDSLAPAQHLQIARMRALEVERPMARATNTGITALIDEHGQIVARAPQFIESTLQGTLQPRTGQTPFSCFGDTLVLFLIIIMLCLSFLRRWIGQ